MKNNVNGGGIELNNVSHSYDGITVLKNLSLNIKPGEFIVLVGPTGCGKSTLLNIISSYLKPQEGSLKTNGTIRTVFQKDGLFPWLKVAENISMGLQSIRMPGHRKKRTERTSFNNPNGAIPEPLSAPAVRRHETKSRIGKSARRGFKYSANGRTVFFT